MFTTSCYGKVFKNWDQLEVFSIFLMTPWYRWSGICSRSQQYNSNKPVAACDFSRATTKISKNTFPTGARRINYHKCLYSTVNTYSTKYHHLYHTRGAEVSMEALLWEHTSAAHPWLPAFTCFVTADPDADSSLLIRLLIRLIGLHILLFLREFISLDKLSWKHVQGSKLLFHCQAWKPGSWTCSRCTKTIFLKSIIQSCKLWSLNSHLIKTTCIRKFLSLSTNSSSKITKPSTHLAAHWWEHADLCIWHSSGHWKSTLLFLMA